MKRPCALKNTGIQNVPSDDEIRDLLNDPALSHWLRDAMLSALERDPVDAANDAGLLALVLDRRAGEVAARAMAQVILINAKRSG